MARISEKLPVRSGAQPRGASLSGPAFTPGIAKLRRIFRHPLAAAGTIFVLAFFLRWLYNCVFMEHRICHYGDAYNFLRSGSCLLETLLSTKSPVDLLRSIYQPAAEGRAALDSMTSMNLTDRLSIDGPVYPAYLAFIEWASGIDPKNPIFDARCLQITMWNSLVDSLCCVLIYAAARLGFNRPTALVAGLLFAIYPGAIINTQHCYSEPFAYFLLSGWITLVLLVCLRHRKRGWLDWTTWLALGLASGLLMLSKPAFAVLPPLVAGELVILQLLSYLRQPGRRGTGAPPLGPASNRNSRTSPLSNALSADPAAFDADSYLNTKTETYVNPKGKQPPSPRHSPAGTQSMFCWLLPLCLGATLSLGPWVAFNKVATGQLSIFVNRVPAFNIFHGNQLKTDGWRHYPYLGCFPGETGAVIDSIKQEASAHPTEFAALQMKKLARLWSGVWNEYHYPLFGIPFEIQSLFHQWLLFAAILDLAMLAGSSPARSRQVKAGAVLATIVCFHFVYLPFESISRYAITAMPAAAMLAAGIVCRCARQASLRALFLSVCFQSLLLFWFLASSGDVARFLAAILPASSKAVVPLLSWLLGTAGIIVLVLQIPGFLHRLIGRRPGPAALVVPWTAAVLVIGTSFSYLNFSHDWMEWQCTLTDHMSAEQTIVLPDDERISRNPVAFVLLDLTSRTLVPPAVVRVNGYELTDRPFPLAQLQPDNNDILQCLAIQGEGMGKDVRSFRHWWAIPVPTAVLRSGGSNNISLSPAPGNVLTLYGDLRLDEGWNGHAATGIAPRDVLTERSVEEHSVSDTGAGQIAFRADGPTYLPSLVSYSYTKGFTTFDHRDPRVFEEVDLLGETRQSELHSGDKTSPAPKGDLSPSPGIQRGRYRMRILVPVERLNRPAGQARLVTSMSRPASEGTETENTVVESTAGDTAPKNFRKPESTVESGADEVVFGPIRLVPPGQTLTVTGGNPASFIPEKSPIVLPANLPSGTRFFFSCRLKAQSGSSPAFVSLNFTGSDSGSVFVWNSQWQPIGIPISNQDWLVTSFGDIIPDRLLRSKNFELPILFSPFQPDYLFLKRKKALKSCLLVEDATLVLLKPLPLPSLKQRQWLVF